MSLDLFAPAIAASDQDVAANAARNLPAGFSETFDVALRSLGEWHNSNAYELARERALASYYDDVRRRTGAQLPLYGISEAVSLADLNAGIGKLADQFPDQGFLPLSDADVDTMARRRMAKAHDDARAMQSRETTWGGTLGTVLGMTAGIAGDPVTIATLPLGGVGEAGIALRGLEFAAIAGGTEAATAALNFRDREAAVPGSSKEIPGEILTATLGGGALGLAFGGLTKLLGRGAKALPTAARDDLNAVTSEAQLNVTNPFPTAAGEAAARDGVNDAVHSIVRGDAVRAGENFDPVHVADYAQAAKAASPDDLAVAGEKHLRPETFDEVPDVEHFDPLPAADDDAASYWDTRLAAASPEERAALGATDADMPSLPRRALPDRVQIGPANFAATPLDRPVWHETSADRAVALLTDDMTNSADGVRTSNLFVADNRDLAIGQGGKGVVIEYDGALVSALEHRKPGTGDLAGREYRTNAIGNSAIRSIEVAPGEALKLKPSWERRFENEFDRIDLPDGAVRFERKAAGVPAVRAPDLSPEQMAALEAEPATADAVAHNLEHILQQNPDAEFTFATRLEDGTTRLDTMKLSDVLKDLDETERAAREIEACAVGLEAME